MAMVKAAFDMIPYDLAAVGLPLVLVATWFGGVGPGIFATVLAGVAHGALAARWSALHGATLRGEIFEVAVWIVEGGLLCLLLGRLREARDQAEARARELCEKNRVLSSRQQDLRSSRETLGRLVAARTDALAAANAELRAEISERIAAETALRETGEMHRLLFSANPMPMWMVDTEMRRFIAVNAAAVELYGYSEEQFLTMSVLDIRLPEDSPSVNDLIRTAGTKWTSVVRHVRRDGTILHVEVHARRLTLGGRPAWISVLHDVTAHLTLEERLRQAQKMEAVGRLAGGVAHDFNNLLSIILSYSAMLIDDLDASDPVRTELQEVHAAGERASELTRQLLAFGRRQVLEPRVIDLARLVECLQAMLRRMLSEDIEMSVVTSRAIVRVDPGQFEQVIMNLVANARDAMPSGGRIGIETSVMTLSHGNLHDLPAGRYGVVSVADTGMGMDAATRSHIFEPFFTTKSTGKGTGLGLATVFGTVQQSGGVIEVESEPGRGSVFRIFLPFVDAEPIPLKESGRWAPRSSRHETVLLVEDDAGVREAATQILVKLGYRVLASSGANEAIALAARHRGGIDLLLTDVVMPGLDGVALARALEAARPGIKVVWMSGYAGEALADRGLGRSGMAFLQKPFTPATLGRKVREVLGESAAR